MEQYFQIPGKYSNYEISTTGVVRYRCNGMLIPLCCSDRSQYISVNIREVGTNKTVTAHLHRLLAMTFIPNTTGLPIEVLHVNHKDGNKWNNQLNNLEWVCRTDNSLHAYQTGLRSDNVQVQVINQYGEHLFFYSQAAAAKYIGVSAPALCIHMNDPDKCMYRICGCYASFCDSRSLGGYDPGDV